MKPKRTATIISFIMMLAFLTACDKSSPTKSSSTYPIGVSSSNASYPAPTTAALPIDVLPYPMDPTPTQKSGTPVEIIPFRLDKPVYEGATEITGTGPANIPILLADITFNGEIIGGVSVGKDGKFVIKLTMPLEKGHRIGIGLDDLTTTQWVQANFNDPGFNGDEAMLVPQVGFFFDSAMVQSK